MDLRRARQAGLVLAAVGALAIGSLTGPTAFGMNGPAGSEITRADLIALGQPAPLPEVSPAAPDDSHGVVSALGDQWSRNALQAALAKQQAAELAEQRALAKKQRARRAAARGIAVGGPIPTVSLTPKSRQIRTLVQRYLPESQIGHAMAVAACESGHTDAIGAVNSNGTRDWGAFQLNDGGTLQWALSAAGVGFSSTAEAQKLALNTEINVRAAAEIYAASGWAPWVCAYKIGIVSGLYANSPGPMYGKFDRFGRPTVPIPVVEVTDPSPDDKAGKKAKNHKKKRKHPKKRPPKPRPSPSPSPSPSPEDDDGPPPKPAPTPSPSPTPTPSPSASTPDSGS